MTESTEQLSRGVSILLYRDGKFAVSRRLSGAQGKHGLWQFAGGHVEPGETYMDAAVRELREETGLMIKPERLYFIATAGPLTGYKGEQYMGTRFVVHLRDNEEPQQAEPEKATPWHWVTPRELCALEMLQATKEYALLWLAERR